AERLCGAGVAGEEGALDHFGQVDEGEDGPVQIGEIGLEGRPFRGGECLHGIILACADPRTGPSRRESAAEGATIFLTRRSVIPVRGLASSRKRSSGQMGLFQPPAFTAFAGACANRAMRAPRMATLLAVVPLAVECF